MKRGVTLIELLVAMAIAALVGYIAFDLVRDEQGNYTKTRNKVRLQADAREAIRIIEEDFASLGFQKGLEPQAGNIPTGSSLLKTCTIGGTSDPVIRADQRLIVIDDGGDSSDIVEGRFFRVSPTNGVICGTTPIRVQYLVRGTQLIRRFWAVGDSTNVRNEAVVLNDVLTLQAQVATDTMLTSLAPVVKALNQPLDDVRVSSSAGFLIPSDSTAYGSNGDTLVGWKGWRNSLDSLVSGFGQKLMPQATYRLSCLIELNQAFRDAFATATDTGVLQVSLRSAGAWSDAVQIRLPRLIDKPFWVSWEFQPDGISSSSTIQFGLHARLAKTDPAARLKVGSIHVLRVGGDPTNNPQKPQWFWRDAIRVNTAKDSLFRTQAEGLKIWLVSSSRRANKESNSQPFQGIGNWKQNGTNPPGSKTYAVYQRILPVVNYGY